VGHHGYSLTFALLPVWGRLGTVRPESPFLTVLTGFALRSAVGGASNSFANADTLGLPGSVRGVLGSCGAGPAHHTFSELESDAVPSRVRGGGWAVGCGSAVC